MRVTAQHCTVTKAVEDSTRGGRQGGGKGSGGGRDVVRLGNGSHQDT